MSDNNERIEFNDELEFRDIEGEVVAYMEGAVTYLNRTQLQQLAEWIAAIDWIDHE